jgi:hypothetical protein
LIGRISISTRSRGFAQNAISIVESSLNIALRPAHVSGLFGSRQDNQRRATANILPAFKKYLLDNILNLGGDRHGFIGRGRAWHLNPVGKYADIGARQSHSRWPSSWTCLGVCLAFARSGGRFGGVSDSGLADHAGFSKKHEDSHSGQSKARQRKKEMTF